MSTTVKDVIVYFYPDAEFSLGSDDDYSTLVWGDNSNEKPSSSRVEELREMITYRAERSIFYPSLEKQLGMIYDCVSKDDDLRAKFSLWVEAIDKIKQEHPKP